MQPIGVSNTVHFFFVISHYFPVSTLNFTKQIRAVVYVYSLWTLRAFYCWQTGEFQFIKNIFYLIGGLILLFVCLGVIIILFWRGGWGWKGFFFPFGRVGWGGEVSVGMLVVVIPRRKRNYFILHFPTSNLYSCRIAVTSHKCKDIHVY